MEFQIISLLIALIAVVISVATLQQNRNMIEESTRSYLMIYYDYIQTLTTPHQYIVLKNFGLSGAVIDSINIEPKFNLYPPFDKVPFSSITDTFIAPNQRFTTCPFNPNISDEKQYVKCRTFTITYQTNSRIYKETIKINEFMHNSTIFTKPSPRQDASLQEVISTISEELMRRNI